ncbi:MAG: CoA pyrophosphatase [Saprospiraceae bacterium]|nr:CoA pyrophosphatase [Saprospiraceae bacterium]
MAHVGRYPHPTTPPEDARDAGVLMLLYPRDEEVYTVFIRRAGRIEQDKHKGQISFPGGKREEVDTDMAASAVRETEEEIGVDRQRIRVLRELTPLYIPVSNFLVHPFVGLAEERPFFTPQPDEVDGILEVPLRDILDPDKKQYTDIPIHAGFILRDVPYYHLDDQIVWGATAMILSEFQTWWEAL